MTRRLLLLNGLAVLMMPFHHASAFGLQAMFEWTDRYLNVQVPNFDLIGSTAFEVTMAIRQLDAWAIPAFFFVSGYFIAFMSRSKDLDWKMVSPRIKVFLVPYFLWIAIRYIELRQFPTSLAEVVDVYYFVTLIIQYYVLSIFLVPMAKSRPKLVLVSTIVIQLIWHAPFYLISMGIDSPILPSLARLTPRWIAPSRIFYFTLGVVGGLYMQPFKAWLTRMRWILVATLIASAILSFIEYDYLTQISGELWIGPNNPGLSRIIYATMVLLCFLAFDKIKFPYAKSLESLGSKSLGIYLVNLAAIYPMAVILYRFAPLILGNQLIYQTILGIVGISAPLILMEAIRRSPLRKRYRLLFG